MAPCGLPDLEPASRQPPENLDFWAFVQSDGDNQPRLAMRREKDGVAVTGKPNTVSLPIQIQLSDFSRIFVTHSTSRERKTRSLRSHDILAMIPVTQHDLVRQEMAKMRAV